MKWQGRRGRKNIEDRRGRGGGTAKAGGIAGVLILLAGLYFGFDTSGFVDLGGSEQTQTSGDMTEADQRAAQFVSVTLTNTEEVWDEVFRDQVGQPYVAPTLVFFKGTTQSSVGEASAASGPFYCPADNKAYLDTDFFCDA